MARDLIRRSGFKPDVDIEIKFTGLRPGEKLHEELITEGEGIVRTPYEKIFVLKGDNAISIGFTLWSSKTISNKPKYSMKLFVQFQQQIAMLTP